MVIFWTLFESGFRMQNGGQSIRKPEEFVRFLNGIQKTGPFDNQTKKTIRKLEHSGI
jgi:hypothetical protein